MKSPLFLAYGIWSFFVVIYDTLSGVMAANAAFWSCYCCTPSRRIFGCCDVATQCVYSFAVYLFCAVFAYYEKSIMVRFALAMAIFILLTTPPFCVYYRCVCRNRRLYIPMRTSLCAAKSTPAWVKLIFTSSYAICTSMCVQYSVRMSCLTGLIPLRDENNVAHKIHQCS